MCKKILFFVTVFFFPLLVFAYDNLVVPPEDLGAFLTWFFSGVGSLKGQGSIIIIGFILTVLIGICKLTALKALFDKLGNWKFLIPMILGAIAELIFNMPSPATFTSIISVIVTGAAGTGAISIAFHHIVDPIFDKLK